MGRNQQSKGGGYAGKQGKQPYASGGKGGNNKKTVDAATALGLGPLPQQNMMLPGLVGLGMAQQIPLDSHFGSVGTNPLAETPGLNAGLQSATPNADPRFKPRFKPPTKNPWFKPRFKPQILNPGFKPPCFCSGT